MPTITTNKSALHSYHILEKFEAGIVLSGAEVKSVKTGHINLKGSYVTLDKGRVKLINAHIAPYIMAANTTGYSPTRDRYLLLHKKEINTLIGKLNTQGLTVLPISVYTKGGLIKIEVAICRGKKLHDKRELIKKRESDRRMRKAMRNKK